MAYRRKHSMPRSSTFEDYKSGTAAGDESPSSPSSLAAQAIRASSAHRDSSLSSAYGESAFSSAHRETNRQIPSPNPQDPIAYEYTSMKSLNESKYGFWGVLARKAKSILEEDNVARQFEDHTRNRSHILDASTGAQFHQPHRSPESYRKMDNPTFHKGSDIASSLNYIGGTIRNALEEGLTIVENKTADIIQETRKLQIRRKSGGGPGAQNQATDLLEAHNMLQSGQETQLKASRDVANAMAAKAKLLLRELKTVKADLAFAKERCAQLEEENKILRENRQKGDNPEDDDLIRHQLETLLAEKGRLAHENSVYARENRFLREIVEYHQLTMQDVIYVDEGSEEVSEVCPINTRRSPAPQDSPPSSPPTPSSSSAANPATSPVDLPEETTAPPPPPILESSSADAEEAKRRQQRSPTPP